ncbi:hypothetical protein [Paenibacillus sp. KS-LC4]|uniref:beta-xylosidase family glycoside hydrolase n=1 Tax=Paenibacillus sp. KS-LC4 TaxID=2979727 RepID=UPI0030CAD7F7
MIFRFRIGSLWKMEHSADYSDSIIRLGIEANETHYTFSYSRPDGHTHVLGTGECAMLSKEVAGGFTGVYAGLYATGNGKFNTSPAYFDWFKYEIEA